MEDLLKEFWPVALFVVISIISYARNDAKMKKAANEQPAQPHTLDENFPNVEYIEQPITRSSDAVKRRPVNNEKHTSKGNFSVKNNTKNIESYEKATHDCGAKIALKGKSDVKKAFIYSEILNRKYK